MSETIIYCSRCAGALQNGSSFCSHCGAKVSIQNFYDKSTFPPIPKQVSVVASKEEDKYTVYLRKRGLLHLADKQYHVLVRLENFLIVRIPLKGRQTKWDAIDYLNSKGYLNPNKSYEIAVSDWPNADPVCMGPGANHFSACVCELKKYKIHRVKSIERRGFLYGCPNPKSIDAKNVLSHVSIEVVDYE